MMVVSGRSGRIYNHIAFCTIRLTVYALYVEFWNKASVVPVISSVLS